MNKPETTPMNSNQMRLILVTDEHNLLKGKYQTAEEYQTLKKKSFETLMQELNTKENQ